MCGRGARVWACVWVFVDALSHLFSLPFGSLGDNNIGADDRKRLRGMKRSRADFSLEL